MYGRVSARVGVFALALVAVPLLVAGCSSGAKPDNTNSSKSSAGSSQSGSTSQSDSTSASGSASTTASSAPSLAGDCSTVLPLSVVERTLGHPVVGETAFIVNKPDPKIGMVSRINCRYGLAKAVKGKPAPAPQVEVSVSLYSTEQQATDRVSGTVADWRDHGASQADAQIGKDAAVLLTGYGNPLLVGAHGERTVAVTVLPALLKGQNMTAVMSALAGQAITNS